MVDSAAFDITPSPEMESGQSSGHGLNDILPGHGSWVGSRISMTDPTSDTGC